METRNKILSMCTRKKRRASHVFIICIYTTQIWQPILGSLIDSFSSQQRRRHVVLLDRTRRKKTCKRLPSDRGCCVWCIWQERNNRTFKFEVVSAPKLLQNILVLLKEWISCHNGRYFKLHLHTQRFSL